MTVRRRGYWALAALGMAGWATTGLAQTAGTPTPDLFVTRLQTTPIGPARDGAKPDSGNGPPLFLTKLDDRQAAADLDGPRRISMTVSRPMPLPDLLLLLVNGTPFSLVTDKDVSGSFIGDLKDLTMRQALEAVLFPYGLDYDLQGALIRVFPRRASTRFFSLNFVNVRRTLQRNALNAAAVESAQRQPAESSAAASSDPFAEIEQGVQSLLSASGRMHVDRTAGLVQVTDFAERLDQIGVYVEAVQVRTARQVRIDAHVFTVEFATGGVATIDWSAPSLNRAAISRPASGYGPAGLVVTNIEAFARALAEQGSVTKIAAPAVVAMNNEPAMIRVGRLVYFAPTPSSDDDQKRMMSPSSVLEGFTLSVLAQISGDHFIQLHVSPSVAAQAGESRDRNGSVAPVIAVNDTDTLMRVRDGETIVLAGFLADVDRVKPASGVAKLFSGPSHTTVRSELVILLTPTIVGSTGASPN